jgi:ABC-type nitrate/sulfonate/bicarbonate transport system substrate-binding protein
MGKLLKPCVLGIAALALLTMSTARAQAQKITVGWSAVSALNAPFWVMKDAGFLKQEGLDANLVYIPSSSTMAQAQVSGDIDISTANSQVIVDADLRGAIWLRLERSAMRLLSMSWPIRRSPMLEI